MPDERFEADYFHGRALPGNTTPGNYLDYERSRFASTVRSLAESSIRLCHPLRALDLGCAKGFLVEALVDRGVDACGTDRSSFALSQARPDIAPRLARIDASHEPQPHPDRHFDLIFALGVLDYVARLDFVLAEIERVAAPGAWLIVHTNRDRSDEPETRRALPNTTTRARWIERFRAHGFSVDQAVSRRIWTSVHDATLAALHDQDPRAELGLLHARGGPPGRWLARSLYRARAGIDTKLVLRQGP